jgi:hypothetical protein
LAAAWALAHRVLAERDAPARGDPGRRGVDPEARRGTQGRSVEGDRCASRVAADRERWGAVAGLAGHGDDARAAQRRWAAAAQAPSQDMAARSMAGIGWHGALGRTLSAAAGAAVEGLVLAGPHAVSEVACPLRAPTGAAPMGTRAWARGMPRWRARWIRHGLGLPMGIGTDAANFPSAFNVPVVMFLQDYLNLYIPHPGATYGGA